MNSPENQAKSLAVYTLGCRSNQYQSSLLENEIRGARYEIRRFGEEAETYVINTCAVTLDAERKSRQAIRRALRFGKKVIVTGCLARLEGDKLKQMYPQIDLTPAPLSISWRGENTMRKVSIPSPRCGEGKKGVRIRANLMIEDGCENFCSYCIVPYARGKVVRKPEKDIIEEARRLAEAGAREIVLTGINLGTWGTLCSVLRALCSLDHLLRVRLSSIEPQYVTGELIEILSQEPKLCNYLHIPLQSGDDRVLKAMNRHYTVKDYSELIDKIRGKIPDCGVSTDVIVGFPGETDEQFKNTVKTIEKIGFSRLHIFPYSSRDLTAASKLPGQVDPKVKKQRFKVLDKIGKEQMKAFAEKYLGKEVEILVEQKGEGLTSNYIRAKFDDTQDLTGLLHKIKLSSNNLNL